MSWFCYVQSMYLHQSHINSNGKDEGCADCKCNYAAYSDSCPKWIYANYCSVNYSRNFIPTSSHINCIENTICRGFILQFIQTTLKILHSNSILFSIKIVCDIQQKTLNAYSTNSTRLMPTLEPLAPSLEPDELEYFDLAIHFSLLLVSYQNF